MEDNVVVRRKKIFVKEEESPSSDDINISEEDNDKYTKAASILLFSISILILLALTSYSRKDESIALTPILDLFGIFTGDESVMFKAETAKNWLGIMGSVISFHFYNSTVGFIIYFLPFFMILMAKDLFKSGNISIENWKKFSFYLLFSLVLSLFMGTLRNTGIGESIPKEFAGNIGSYLSVLSISFIGTIGSIIVSLLGMTLIIIFGTNVSIDSLLQKAVAGAEAGSSVLVNSISGISFKVKDKIKEKVLKKEENNNSPDKTEELEINNDINVGEVIEDLDENIQDVSEEKINEIKEDDNITIRKTERSELNGFKEKKDKIEAPANPLKITLNRNQNAISSFDQDYGKDEKEDNTETSIQSKSETPQQLIQEIEKEESHINETIQNELKNELDDLINNWDEDDLPNEVEVHKHKLSEISNTSSNETYIDDNTEINKAPIQEPEKKLVLDVEVNDQPEEELDTPLSTLIHDEKINYKEPDFSLLDEPADQKEVDDDELKNNGRILQEKLETFKISIENLQVTPGPVVTQYAFTPAAGIKISRIENLSDDLAMALKAKGIRIIAPIPGKGSVGVEIPNADPSLVTFSSVIRSRKFQEAKLKMHLPMAMGKTISGEVAVADLSKMPHLLVAGSTGSGKSVGVNTMINSLLYSKSPDELKFVIVDPKKVELQHYNSLKNHFLAVSPDINSKIVTEPIEAIALLKSTVLEMEKRYDILASVGQRNIADYNEKVRQGKYKNRKDMLHRPMPYIVVVIDEYADLILTAGKEVEEPIVRLAQMARAIGIHMILATQRPSVDVITGIIKANFPARIAYRVASKIDSRTILDVQGAEKLLGNGDMLFFPAGKPKPERIQSPFVSTDEVENVCEFIGNQRGYSLSYTLPSIHEKGDAAGDIAVEDRDPLFNDAARLVVSTQQGSVSMIQRRLKVGYARAGRIVDELEDAGIVGPFEGSKSRQVLLESESELESII